MFSGAPAGGGRRADQYGDTIGVAFQLSDDLLDIASESAESGKTPGTDLREGVPDPAGALRPGRRRDRRQRGPAARDPARPGPITDDALVAEALELLRESAALKRARETVRGYAERARAQLVGLPDVPARHALESLADFIADRSA